MSAQLEQNLPVKMLRRNLDNVPDFPLPAGFTLRWFRAGDEDVWVQLQAASDQFNRISLDLFRSEFVEPGLLANTQFYVIAQNNAPVGTATAWFKDLEGKRIGRVHWVAVLPAFQGRGLGKSVLSLCCGRLRELGYDKAYLSTSSARIPAIKLYLSFGFEPLIGNGDDKAVWSGVSRSLA